MTVDLHPFAIRLREAGLLTTPDPPRGTPTTPLVMPADRAGRYAKAALQGECDNIAAAGEGTRNDTLNRAAWKLGRLVADGHLGEQEVIDALGNAAHAAGLGVGEINQTVPRAVGDGAGKQYRPATSREPDTAATGTGYGDAYTLDDDDLAPTAGDTMAAADAAGAWVAEHLPRLDWHELWADEREEEWVVEPIIALGRSIVIYAPAKLGKSLLALEMAAAISTGRKVLGVDTVHLRVLYVDFENDPRGDIRARLRSMGYGPDDLTDLVLLSYPSLAALDTQTGADQLVAAIRHYQCGVVVIDTISRAVEGEENSNDTWLNFYKHTGMRLKRERVAVVRLDHTGKDEARGMRGGSAKTGDIDAMWRLIGVDDMQFALEADLGSRMPLPDGRINMIRNNLPRLHHAVDRSSTATRDDAKVAEIMAALESVGATTDTTVRDCKKALRGTGVTARSALIERAIKTWKSAANTTYWDG